MHTTIQHWMVNVILIVIASNVIVIGQYEHVIVKILNNSLYCNVIYPICQFGAWVLNLKQGVKSGMRQNSGHKLRATSQAYSLFVTASMTASPRVVSLNRLSVGCGTMPRRQSGDSPCF